MNMNTATFPITTYATAGEAMIARRLIRICLADGYTISVNDGEEWTVRRSNDFNTIIGALCTTGQDFVRAFNPKDQTSPGTFDLVWGNDPTGAELISDHTYNEVCNSIYKDTMKVVRN